MTEPGSVLERKKAAREKNTRVPTGRGRKLTPSVETNKGRFYLDEAGVVRGEALPGTDQNYTRADAEVLIGAIATLAEGRRVPILLNMSQIRSVDREARDYFSSPAIVAVAQAVALVVPSPVSRVIGSFFIGINRPPFPIKLFVSEDDAHAWLLRSL